MEFGHNIKYQNVFLKFDNGPYWDMHSGVIVVCEKNTMIIDIEEIMHFCFQSKHYLSVPTANPKTISRKQQLKLRNFYLILF